MSTVTVQLPNALKARLDLEARRLRRSPARIVREALQSRLASPRTGNGSSLYQRSKDLCASVTGGPRDLAGNKKHLAGYGSWRR